MLITVFDMVPNSLWPVPMVNQLATGVSRPRRFETGKLRGYQVEPPERRGQLTKRIAKLQETRAYCRLNFGLRKIHVLRNVGHFRANARRNGACQLVAFSRNNNEQRTVRPPRQADARSCRRRSTLDDNPRSVNKQRIVSL